MIQPKLAATLIVTGLVLAVPASAVEEKKPSKPASRPASAGKASAFAGVRDRYVKTFLRRFPVVATYLGAAGLDRSLVALDGALRDYSPAALRAERQQWEGFAGELRAVDRRKLSPAEAVDAEVMASQLAFLIRLHEKTRHEGFLDVYVEEPFRGVEWALRALTPTGEATAGTAAEWNAITSRVGAIPTYLKTALANVKKGTAGTSIPDRRLIASAVQASEKAAEYFETELPRRASASIQPGPAAVERKLAAACAPAGRAYRDFRQGLLSLFYDDSGKALKREFDRDRFAVGEAEYAWLLKSNLRVERTPREVHALGRQKVGETLVAMTALAGQVARERGLADADLAGVVAKLGDGIPSGDEQMLEWYRAACRRLSDYGRSQGLFAVPADYQIDVVFTPPPLRDTTSAAYYPAPPFTRSGVGQFYVTPTGDDPAALREHARAAVASLAAHEGFPGHDWQYRFLRGLSPSVSPVRWLLPGGVEDSASMWADSMLVEGWALYAEELMGEPREGAPWGAYTAEEKLIQLQSQLLRDARLVVDTGIHCGLMSFDEAVAWMARNVFFVKGPVDPARNADPAEKAALEAARKEIFRYSKWPAQAITYALGKAEIKGLREEVQRIEGERFDLRRFHEELLSQGTIPPGLWGESLLASARERAAR